VAGRLTTHVLDTASGLPAAGMAVALYRLGPGPDDRTLLARATTDADGRAPGPLLSGDDLTAGVYELVFEVGAYFAARATTTATLPFLDRVPIRFGVADPGAHYHVPLLVSPWSYTTYRGS
jgi:5-hydroxyisourate hydrolase